ncbi:hypothetical protein HYH02_005309 [Chlamydomonas schloesseri]|uniref:Uncharacterized protein n=1 Tax=Chlamydomonas schloesseri TaxID=2026947 RepID=A0A835WLQ7_9CHLO|nr:hypothetical protein HYH02_005309 [Chlamydomonas schloesseri]|eukprot:KAG2449785.1 hypothetical protein HYH02_005309 [Chlamydomonas schloesseri]
MAAGAEEAPIHWGNVRPESWLHSGAGPSPVFEDDDDAEDEADRPATTYRQVFATLRRMQPLMGLWRGVGDAPYGSLFRIAWSAPAFRRANSTPLTGAVTSALAPAGGDEEPGTPSAGASRRTSGTNAAGAAGAAGGIAGSRGGGGGHVEVVALRGGKGLTELAEDMTARVGPTGTLGTSLQLVDESLAILKDKPWRRAAGPGGAGGPSAAALAAAAVATGTHALSIRDRSGTSPAGPGGSSSGGAGAMSEHPLGLLGASPPKSFGYEMLRFMAGSVAGSRSGGRKKDKRGGGGGMGGMGAGGGPAGGGVRRQAVILQHLVRLKVAAPSRQRPMSGVWSGVYGPHGVEVVSLGYEGTGSRARLVATKVTGDPNVPAGQVSFWAEAEPLPQPWPLSEVELISNRPFFTSNPALELANAVAAATAEAEAAAGAAAGGAAPAVVPPGVLAVPPGVLPAPAGVHAAPVWAQPGVAAAIGQAAPAAPPLPPPQPVPPPPPVPDAGLGALDPQAAIQAHLAAAAAAAAAAEPADLWALLRPQPPPPGVPAASMSRTGSTTTVGLAGQEAAAQPAEGNAGAAGAPDTPAGAGPAAARRTPLRVVAIYKGQGRVAGAGFSNPAWIDGRLWVYDNGRIGLLWRGDFDFIVDLERLSATQCGLDLSVSAR